MYTLYTRPESPSRSAVKRRRLEDDFSKICVSSNHRLNVSAFCSPKYKINSAIQTERLYRPVSMIVKCMLPISTVENKAFVDYINYIDPSFSMPTRPTIKNHSFTTIKKGMPK